MLRVKPFDEWGYTVPSLLLERDGEGTVITTTGMGTIILFQKYFSGSSFFTVSHHCWNIKTQKRTHVPSLRF